MESQPKPKKTRRPKKGFPVSMSLQHWTSAHQIYTWLKSLGYTTPEMDEAAKLIPARAIPAQEPEAYASGLSRKMNSITWIRSATVRFSGDQVVGAIQLLNAAGAYITIGGCGKTFRTRAEKLRAVNLLDLMTDASR